MDDINTAAKSEGWALGTMFENGTTKPLWEIRGVTMADVAARAHVLALARSNSRLHQQALQAVFQSRAAPAAKRKAR
jgi:hypothetical protein